MCLIVWRLVSLGWFAVWIGLVGDLPLVHYFAWELLHFGCLLYVIVIVLDVLR